FCRTSLSGQEILMTFLGNNSPFILFIGPLFPGPEISMKKKFYTSFFTLVSLTNQDENGFEILKIDEDLLVIFIIILRKPIFWTQCTYTSTHARTHARIHVHTHIN